MPSAPSVCEVPVPEILQAGFVAPAVLKARPVRVVSVLKYSWATLYAEVLAMSISNWLPATLNVTVADNALVGVESLLNWEKFRTVSAWLRLVMPKSRTAATVSRTFFECCIRAVLLVMMQFQKKYSTARRDC